MANFRLPEYSLKKGIEYIPPGSGMDAKIEFPSGTLIMPFWNETLLPSHIKEEFKEAKKELSTPKWGQEPKDKGVVLIMCIIGKYWIPIDKNNIRKN